MTDTATTTRLLVKGYRSGNDNHDELWGIRDMSAQRGPDVATYRTEEARDTAFNAPETIEFYLTSDENGGNWRAPITWEAVPDVDWATAEEAVPETREAQGRALATMRQREAAALAEAERYRNYYNGALATAQAHESKLRSLWNALKEQAIERDWCSEFEEFVSENNGDDYVELSKTVKVTLEVEVNWRDADDEAQLAEHIFGMERWNIQSSIESFEEA